MKTINPNRQGPIPSLTRVPGHSSARTVQRTSPRRRLCLLSALAQHTLHRLPLRVKAKGKGSLHPGLAQPRLGPTRLALACSALTHAGLLCDPGQVPSPL